MSRNVIHCKYYKDTQALSVLFHIGMQFPDFNTIFALMQSDAILTHTEI